MLLLRLLALPGGGLLRAPSLSLSLSLSTTEEGGGGGSKGRGRRRSEAGNKSEKGGGGKEASSCTRRASERKNKPRTGRAGGVLYCTRTVERVVLYSRLPPRPAPRGYLASDRIAIASASGASSAASASVWSGRVGWTWRLAAAAYSGTERALLLVVSCLGLALHCLPAAAISKTANLGGRDGCKPRPRLWFG